MLHSRPSPGLLEHDDVGVARTLSRILSKQRCEVVMKNSAAEACELLLDEEQGFDLVFCDLMMPSLNGDALYRRVTSKHPELARRFVMMTGGAFTAEGRSFLDSVSVPVLDKPFDVRLVRELVSRRGCRG